VTEAALWRRLLAELLGSALLGGVVVGSGIAAQRYLRETPVWSCWRTRRPPLPACSRSS
jgi:hypothetical protein